MDILIYIDSMAPAGGIERVVSKHAYYFSKNHTVTLLTKDNQDSFYILPSRLVRKSLYVNKDLNMNSKIARVIGVLKQAFSVKNKLKKNLNGYQLYYCTHIRNLLELYMAGVDMKKVILTEHGSYYGYNLVYKIIKGFLYPKCGAIVSPTLMDYYIYNSKKCNAFYIPNPLSFMCSKLEVPEKKVVLNIGRLTEDKRQAQLLYIWGAVSRKHPSWLLKIVGKGELKDELVALIKLLELNESVEIIDPVKNVEDVYLSASIFTLTSKYEGFGMVLVEAMTCGLPCISFDIPSGPKDIIKNGENGYLVREGDVKSYISRLEELMIGSEKRIKMGLSAKKSVLSLQDTNIEKKWHDLLNKGIEK